MTARTSLFAIAAGYFACYVPYSAITKALSAGGTSGLELLPIITLASLAGLIATFTAMRWWRHARLARWTALSGLATATIILTTTLAYTFDGVSIAFVMLVMRGGVLVIAPIVDRATGRHIRWFSWAALGLSLISLGDALVTREDRVPLACAVDLALYLVAYLVRLRLMAHLGKSEDRDTRTRYFVEEQLVAVPVAVLLVIAGALVGPAVIHVPLRAGFAAIADPSIAPWLVVAGACSQGTGVFGALLLLDASEASYCVPLNRAASIVGGFVATLVLAAAIGGPLPTAMELAGAALLVVAVGILYIGPRAKPQYDDLARPVLGGRP